MPRNVDETSHVKLNQDAILEAKPVVSPKSLHNQPRKRLGRALKAARHKAGWAPTDVAVGIQMPVTWVLEVEDGRRNQGWEGFIVDPPILKRWVEYIADLNTQHKIIAINEAAHHVFLDSKSRMEAQGVSLWNKSAELAAKIKENADNLDCRDVAQRYGVDATIVALIYTLKVESRE